MKKTEGLFKRYHQKLSPAMAPRIAESIGIAILLIATGAATAQVAMPDTPSVAPNGYTLHGSINLGGNMTSLTGSGAMYDTMVNIQSGPRVLGSSFQLQALPTTKHTLVDSLTAYSTGWGGNPYDQATMNFSKGKVYQFSGRFRRDRQYFDYNLLGNPNIPSGESIPIGPTTARTGSLAWPQVKQSPFLYNTVRRMTDTNLTIFPISKVTYRFAYSQNVFQGPSLSPGASSPFFAASIGTNTQLLEQYQRNSTDDFIGGIDWKPVPRTTLTFEEEVDHYKNGSYFTLAPSDFIAQEADGTPVAPGGWDSIPPYGLGSCNTGSMGAAPYTILSPAQTPGGLPIINPACSVATSYLRSQPTRILYPTEIFRFQSSSIPNVAMNGDVRYTNANMNLPNYYENFQGLSGAVRSITYTGNANAKRKVIAVDYGINWNATKTISVADQIVFSNVQQPGVANISKGSTLVTPPNPNETINYSGPLTPGTPVTVEGNPNGTPQPGFFGQKFVTNNLMATWDGWSRATFSVTYRYQTHIIAEGIPHNAPLAPGATNNGTVTIHENGGIFNVGLRPTEHWDVNGSLGLFYNDNAFTPLTPRQTQRYRVHTIIRPKSWATLSGAFNDVERHNNTNNQGTPSAAGPLDHVDHSRVVSVGAVMSPNAHYGFDFNYSYGDVYSSTNICYDAGASPTLPGAATPSGTACPGTAVRGTTYYEFGPVKDFIDAPTQYGSVALHLSPTDRIQSSIGYIISSVNGSRFFNDARDVNGSLVSTYQSPYVNFAWAVRKAWSLSAEYNFYGYGEGGPSGAALCSTSNPTPTSPVTVVPCNSPTLAGLQTGLTISPAGETAPRNFHANNLTLGMHYEF
ncbi:MAG: hypothetical protein RB191_20910 [Terriglobia bacterium]|nr:hypothetical protein [Terriglobia bacterium]